MKKILVILLCMITLISMLTASSVSSQRNAWKKEAEKAWQDHEDLMEEYAEYQEETKEKIQALTTERDAFSFLTQAIEAENTQLKTDMESLLLSMQDTAAGLEEQLTQANADKAWAEQRLREALDVLSTPVPFSADENEMIPDEKETAVPAETPAPIVFPEGKLNFSPLTDTVKAIFTLPISTSVPAEEAESTQSPVPIQTPSPQETEQETAAE